MMPSYKKSGLDFSGLNLPSQYKFRRAECVEDPAVAKAPDLSVYPYDTTLYTCAASITWLNKNTIPHTQFAVGSGTLELIKTVNVSDAVPQHTATIVITNKESGRVLCREPIRRGYDFSSLQNKLPPTKKELRCVSFEVATGAPMFITCDSLEIATRLWKKIRMLQKDVYLI